MPSTLDENITRLFDSVFAFVSAVLMHIQAKQTRDIFQYPMKLTQATSNCTSIDINLKHFYRAQQLMYFVLLTPSPLSCSCYMCAVLYRCSVVWHVNLLLQSCDDSPKRLLCRVLPFQCLSQLLGFLDLCQLSLHSPQRRKQVFSLSTAGQPQVWSDVCDQCLQVVRSLIERLTAGKGTAAPPPPARDKPSLSDRQFPHYTPTGKADIWCAVEPLPYKGNVSI